MYVKGCQGEEDCVEPREPMVYKRMEVPEENGGDIRDEIVISDSFVGDGAVVEGLERVFEGIVSRRRPSIILALSSEFIGNELDIWISRGNPQSLVSKANIVRNRYIVIFISSNFFLYLPIDSP